MPSDKADDKNLHELDQLLGEPPLLNGEDKARYMKLRAAVEAELKRGSAPANAAQAILFR
jgi:hypothetical protein